GQRRRGCGGCGFDQPLAGVLGWYLKCCTSQHVTYLMEFSLDALEYYRLKELLGRYISTDAGRFALDELAPMLDEQKLESEHAITAEAMSYLREHRVPFNDIPLVGQALEKLTIVGTTLEIAEIEAIQSFLSHVEGLRVRWKEEREKFPKLSQTAQRLPDLRDLGKHRRRPRSH